MQKGSIFYHENFQFKNGEIGEKLLVLLNNPKRSEPYLFCRTTAVEMNKSLKPGCQVEYSLFFIPQKTEWFIRNTWLQLYEIYAFDAATVLKDSWVKVLDEKSQLKGLTIRQLMNCIKQIKEIEIQYKKMILRD